jgi:predicted MFS family arabinose efflux permease
VPAPTASPRATSVVKLGRAMLGRVGRGAHLPVDKFTKVVQGPARRRVVLLFACVLSLDAADKGAVGALAPQLERSFHMGNTKFGLLVTVSTLVGAVATLPMGVLADRVQRVRILTVAIVLWAGGMVLTGLSVSYLMLLLSRLALGAVTAAAGPVVASLTGDLFPAAERGRMYGYILTGELFGTGGGVLVAGDLGAALGWRVSFFLLAAPSVVLAIILPRLLPEPARGGQSRLRPGDEEIRRAPRGERVAGGTSGRSGHDRSRPDSPVREAAANRDGIEVEEGNVVHADPSRMTMWAAVRYVLGVRSNRVLIVSSALGYFFLGGLRSFAVLFARGQFGLGQGIVSILLVVIGGGAVLGTLLSGRFTDRLISRGITDGRVIVAGASFAAASLVFVAGFATRTLLVALPAFVVGAALLSAPNPPLDAARLDVVPSLLWGRAESVRTTVRGLFEAFAPLSFGFVSQLFGGAHSGFGAGVRGSHAAITPQATRGLDLTFLVMLAPLALSGVVLLGRRRAYLVDAAAADASEAAGS